MTEITEGRIFAYPARFRHLVIAGVTTFTPESSPGYPGHSGVQKALTYSVYIGSMLSALTPGAVNRVLFCES
jgi:hypothetical protein